MERIILLLTLLFSFSLSAAEQVQELEKFKKDLPSFIERCSDVSGIDALSISYRESMNPLSYSFLLYLAKLNLKNDIPNASEIRDENFFLHKSTMFSKGYLLDHPSCKRNHKRLFSDKVWKGMVACNKADECGDVIVLQGIYNSKVYTITVKNYYHN